MVCRYVTSLVSRGNGAGGVSHARGGIVDRDEAGRHGKEGMQEVKSFLCEPWTGVVIADRGPHCIGISEV